MYISSFNKERHNFKKLKCTRNAKSHVLPCLILPHCKCQTPPNNETG